MLHIAGYDNKFNILISVM